MITQTSASEQCMETCPSRTIEVVNGSIEDVTTSHTRGFVYQVSGSVLSTCPPDPD